jgi:hypothetical protein
MTLREKYFFCAHTAEDSSAIAPRRLKPQPSSSPRLKSGAFLSLFGKIHYLLLVVKVGNTEI